MTPIRVLLVDDQALVRSGFALILDGRDDIEVVGEAGDGSRAVALAGELRPDVVLMDIRMPGPNGTDEPSGIVATQQIVAANSAVRVVMLTTFDEDDLVQGALRAGASGFLLKDIRPAELADAVRVVHRGDALLAPSVTRRLLEEFAARPPAVRPAALADLTARELDVLRLAARGASNDEIATALTISAATVKTHMTAILRKLDARDRVQAVVLAYDCGLVQPGP